MEYTERLTDPRWQKKRLEILNRDNWTCQTCSDTKTTLAIHHKKYVGLPWDSPNNDLITVCKHCHDVVSYYKIDIGELFLKPAFKVSNNGRTVLFFNLPSGFIIANFTGNILSFHDKISNSDTRKLVQNVINNWLLQENDHLLIDQSPLLIHG